MKKVMLVILVMIILTGLLGGCSNGSSGADPTPADNTKTNGEAIPTLDEVISGTWKLYAGFDQSGNLVYISSESADFTFTFDANNGFSGVYRQGDGYVDASFTGTYDVTDSKATDKNPYNWYYYAKIDNDSIVDSGSSTLIGRLGGDHGLNFIFKFRELDGEKVLYEEMQRLYFKK